MNVRELLAACLRFLRMERPVAFIRCLFGVQTREEKRAETAHDANRRTQFAETRQEASAFKDEADREMAEASAALRRLRMQVDLRRGDRGDRHAR